MATQFSASKRRSVKQANSALTVIFNPTATDPKFYVSTVDVSSVVAGDVSVNSHVTIKYDGETYNVHIFAVHDAAAVRSGTPGTLEESLLDQLNRMPRAGQQEPECAGCRLKIAKGTRAAYENTLRTWVFCLTSARNIVSIIILDVGLI